MRALLFTRGALAALFTLLCAAAGAHPGIGYNLRAMHVAHDADGATVYVRLTLPLVIAHKLGAPQPDGTFVPAPFTYNRLESGKVFHYLDFAALRRDGAALAQLVAQGHELRVGDRLLLPQSLAVRVHVKGSVPPFDSVDEARAAVAGALSPANEAEIDAGYVLVDTALRYEHPGGLPNYSVRSTLVPGELGEPLTRNIVWDHRGSVTDVYETRGLLADEWQINPDAAQANEAARND